MMWRAAFLWVVMAAPVAAFEWAAPGTVFWYEHRTERPIDGPTCRLDERQDGQICISIARLRQEVLEVDGNAITWAEEAQTPPRTATHFVIRQSQSLVVSQRYLVANPGPAGEALINVDVVIEAEPTDLQVTPSEEMELQWVEQWAGPRPREVQRALATEYLESDPFDLAAGPVWLLSLEEISEAAITRLWVDMERGWPVRIERVYDDGAFGTVRATSELVRVEHEDNEERVETLP